MILAADFAAGPRQQCSCTGELEVAELLAGLLTFHHSLIIILRHHVPALKEK